MNTHIDANGGLVSNPSDREIQGSSAHAAAPNLDVGTSSWDEPHVAKRDIGQLRVYLVENGSFVVVLQKQYNDAKEV